MIQKEEHNKLVGRFIGSKSKLISKVSVIDFNLEEISITDTAQTDNINSNIIHARYHEEEAISKISQTPEIFGEELINPSMQPPIMVPLDFTKEWLEEKFSTKKKISSAFENEADAIAEINSKFADILGENLTPEKKVSEFEVDLDENQRNENGLQKSLGEDTSTEDQKNNDDSSNHAPASGGLDSLGLDTSTIQADENDLSKVEKATIISQEASMDYLSKQINDANLESNPSDSDKITNEKNNSSHETNPPSDNEFVPLETQSNEVLNEVDKKSVENYLSKKEIEEIRQKAYEDAISEIDLDKIQQEAKSRGFEDGFKQGEAKASLSNKAETEEAMSKVAELVDEFEKLKFNVLENVQENFREVTQALCEAVLDRAIALDPNRFADVIKSAIDQTIEGDEFKVRVSPEKFKQFENLDLGSLAGKFVEDGDLSKDEFKVDSNLTSVSSSIKEIIIGLLNKADLSLFEAKDEEASETNEKAG